MTTYEHKSNHFSNNTTSTYSVPPLTGIEDLKMDESRKRRFSVSAEDSERSGVPLYKEEFEKRVYPKSDKVKERIVKSVKELFIWKGLDKEQRKLLIDAMFEKKCEIGEEVIKQGDYGDNFYVVESGKYEVWKSPNLKNKNLKFKKVYEYNNGGAFGELALMYNTKRQATVKCVKCDNYINNKSNNNKENKSILWAVDGETFRFIMVRHTIKKRSKFNAFLKSNYLFKNLSDEIIGQVADILEVKEYEQNDIIVSENENPKNKYFYLIQHGTIDVFVNNKKVNTLSDNQFFGERAIIFNQERSASCKVVSKRARLLYMDDSQFLRIVDLFYSKIKKIMEKYVISNTDDIDLDDDE